MSDDGRLSREELDALPVLDIPTFNPVQFNVSANSNEFTIVGAESKSLLQGTSIAPVLRMAYSVALKLSPQSAKDLALNLSRMVEQYEGVYGPLDTDLVRTVDGKNEQE